jgi:hypothetical protein
MQGDNAFLKVGDKVSYISSSYFEGSGDKDIEIGIVKEISEVSESKNFVWVVFNCNGDWENYQKYTGQLTHTKHLQMGWDNSKIEKARNFIRKIRKII